MMMRCAGQSEWFGLPPVGYMYYVENLGGIGTWNETFSPFNPTVFFCLPFLHRRRLSNPVSWNTFYWLPFLMAHAFSNINVFVCGQVGAWGTYSINQTNSWLGYTVSFFLRRIRAGVCVYVCARTEASSILHCSYVYFTCNRSSSPSLLLPHLLLLHHRHRCYNKYVCNIHL